MTVSPKVSIGLPVFNGSNYVAQAIESLLGQTFGDFELIISDNGSQDETPDICRSYASLDRRVRFYREEQNRGVAWNFNRVLELARGRYFKWAAHDDLNAPDQLAHLVELLDSDPLVVLAGFQAAVIDEHGECLAPASRPRQGNPFSGEELNFEPAWREQARRRNTASESPWRRFHGVLLDSQRCYEAFALVRTEVLRQTGCYSGYRGCEKVILAELALRGRFAEAPQVLFFSRWHDDRYSAQTSARQQALHFSPEARQRLVLPFQFRCTREYLRAIWRAPVSVPQKLACCGVMLRFVLQLSKWPGIVAAALRGQGDTARMPQKIERLGRHPHLPAPRETRDEPASLSVH